MKGVELTLKSGNKITFFPNGGNIAIWYDKSDNLTYIQDGNHNNGGWPIKESYETVVKKFKNLKL